MILDEILASTKERVRALEGREFPRDARPHRSLSTAIGHAPGRNAIIAEIKFASPSRGRIRGAGQPERVARDLVAGGCCALSVLTEPWFFGGSNEYLSRVRDAVGVPVLRKDFIIDPIQLDETAAIGGDAVLLIASILGDRLPAFVEKARALGIEPLVEVHTAGEARAALRTRAGLIGVNNRNLGDFGMDFGKTFTLGPRIRRAGRRVVSESGIRTPDDIRALRPACDAFLVGSTLMASEDPGRT
ncbi:MAG TPA: indole-3-glycerol phosphate synthase TrpC, partial [Methanomicrobiales archaeon]|nr:indole-3-glycerol phosphate synthase TrpC [Methanomicrobiales archaeon]